MIQVTWWGEVWFHLTGYSSSLSKARAGSEQERNFSQQGLDAETLVKSCFLANSRSTFIFCFLILASASCLRMLSPHPVDWVPVYKLVIKKMCHIAVLSKPQKKISFHIRNLRFIIIESGKDCLNSPRYVSHIVFLKRILRWNFDFYQIRWYVLRQTDLSSRDRLDS